MVVDSENSKAGGERVMEVYARVHGGVTARLGAVAKKGNVAGTRVFLDGPYGGIEGNIKVYDRALLLGGGSGTWQLGAISCIVRLYRVAGQV